MKERQIEEHKTVLLEKAIEVLQIKNGNTIIDATLGNGGHTLKMLQAVGTGGQVIALDLDKIAIDKFRTKIEDKFPELNDRLILVNDNFKNIKGILARLYARGGIKSSQVHAILADLGWRIEQVKDKKYGMSFREDAPLDMRFDLRKNSLTAYQIINEWSSKELANIFLELGEEREARQIAQSIVISRQKKRIETTGQLAKIISVSKKARNKKIHPATKVFQALRIVVNEEFSNLNKFLEDAVNVLKSEGRLAIISFHSLEDRLVKNFFRAKARGCVCSKEIPVCNCGQKREIKIVFSKGVAPDAKEIFLNRRSRSARMRVAQKI